jgi:hypothetical protein
MKLYLKNNLKQKGLEACLKGWSSNPSTAKKKKKKKKRVNIQTQAAAVLSIPCCPLCRGEKQSQNHLQLCSQFRTQVSPSPEGLLSGSLCKVLRVP